MFDIYVVIFCSSEELREKYEGKLSKEITGPTYEVLGKVMKTIVNRKITVPGGFVG
jgi:structure-specific recognition protein 1